MNKILIILAIRLHLQATKSVKLNVEKTGFEPVIQFLYVNLAN